MITLIAVSRLTPVKANYKTKKKGTKMTTQDERKASTKTQKKLKPNKETITIRDLSPSGKLVRGGGMRFVDGKQVDGIRLPN